MRYNVDHIQTDKKKEEKISSVKHNENSF